MKSYWKWIESRLLPCLNCGSLRTGKTGLCIPCHGALEELLSSSKRAGLKTLYAWSPGSSDLLSMLVLNLKGRKQARLWDELAERFLQVHFPATGERRLHFVPAPSRDGSVDHAALFAMSLARRTGGVYLPCLRKSASRTQRGSGRGERFLLEIELDEKNTLPLGDWAEIQWIFVDDIVTTGSTAQAAKRALGSPPHFEVWVLAERGLSCGASRDLL